MCLGSVLDNNTQPQSFTKKAKMILVFLSCFFAEEIPNFKTNNFQLNLFYRNIHVLRPVLK